METNPPKRPRSKFVRFFIRPLFLLIGAVTFCATVYQVVMNVFFGGNLVATSSVDEVVLPIVHVIALIFFLVMTVAILRLMQWFDRFWLSLFTWRSARRILVGLAMLATLTAIFYAEENWRGKRAWDQCKRELEAQGEVIEWSAYLPTPIPDEQNVFQAPKISEWLIRKSFEARDNIGGPDKDLNKSLSTSTLAKFVQKRHANPVAEITFFAAKDSRATGQADAVLRTDGRMLRVYTTNDVPPPTPAIIPLLQLDDVPLNLAISNLARQADLKFEFDPKVLSAWRQLADESSMPKVSVRWENLTAREALLAVMATYQLGWIDGAQPGIMCITLAKPTDPSVVLAKDTAEQLKQLLRHRFQARAAIPTATNLVTVRTFQFAADPLPPTLPLRIVVRTDDKFSAGDLKDFLPHNLSRVELAGGIGWCAESSGSNSFHVFFEDGAVYYAGDYLAWSDQFAPEFTTLREALQRPLTQMSGDYSRPFAQPVPHFVATRQLAQTLAERAQCYLLLGQPENALKELALLRDLHRFLNSKPTTLVAAMIDVAITGLYAGIIADGFRLHAWHEPELIALQQQLGEVQLPPLVMNALHTERAAVCESFLHLKAEEMDEMFRFRETKAGVWERVTSPIYLLVKFAPRGWIYQNLVNIAQLRQTATLEAFDSEVHRFLPQKALTEAELQKAFSPWHPYKVLARVAIPNFSKAIATTARHQTTVNEALVACGLERFRQARGGYPETLDALVPQFLGKLPHDLIGGQPLRYQRTANDKFLLYSLGWNEKDDGGKITFDKNGTVAHDSPDWVWPVSAN